MKLTFYIILSSFQSPNLDSIVITDLLSKVIIEKAINVDDFKNEQHLSPCVFISYNDALAEYYKLQAPYGKIEAESAALYIYPENYLFGFSVVSYLELREVKIVSDQAIILFINQIEEKVWKNKEIIKSLRFTFKLKKDRWVLEQSKSKW